MAIVVIGGQAKDVGKTGVVCALISAMPERHWTAVKISSAHGIPGDCTPLDRAAAVTHAAAIFEERDSTSGADSSRYLAAGAARAFYVRTAEEQFAQAMPGIRAAMAAAENVILESNSILGWLQPDLYAIVLDPRIADFKASALRYLDRADAILLCAESMGQPNWSGVSPTSIEHTPTFRVASPCYDSAEFNSFVAGKLAIVGKTSLAGQ
jgi:molybdopterin-guanine dinucleotide biosynthesis protein